jgi:hypothetical protein
MPVRTTSELSIDKRRGTHGRRRWRIFATIVAAIAFLWLLPSYSVLLVTSGSKSPAFVTTEVGEIRERVVIESQRSHFAAHRQGKEGALGVSGVPGCESVYVPAGFSAVMTCRLEADHGVRSLARAPSIACGVAMLMLALAFWEIGRRTLARFQRSTK